MRLSARVISIAIVGAVVFLLPPLVDFLADWLWFAEVGFRPVYATELTARAELGLGTFVVAFAWLTLHLRMALSSLSTSALTFTTREGLTVALPSREQIGMVVTLVGAIVAFLVASYASSQWLPVLSWWNQTPFGAADPILNLDVSFYVFTLPVLELIRGLALTLILLAAAGAGTLYLISGQLGLTPFGPRIGPLAQRHLSWLAASLFVVMALTAWLSRVQEITTTSGIIQGASYADVFARMPADLVLVGASLLGAGLAAASAVGGSWRLLFGAAALYGVALIGGGAYASLLQRFAVTPNEQVRETPYIEHNITSTRAAYALDQVEERELNGATELTRADVDANRATLDNVRLWDHQPLLETFGQIQEIRTYYDFMSVDNDRYVINGQNRQVMLSVRELNPNALPNRTWVNERLVFTHGHGLTLGPVNQVTSEGLPVLFVRDLPPVSSIDLPVTQPSVYFGELVNDYVIVRTRAQEFHYPKGDDNVFSQYDGTGGVLLDSLWAKLLFAARFRSYQILLSDDITAESRVMFDRQVRRRVSKIAPFLVYDDDPYPVISGGRLYWIQDAYTTSNRYPYASSATPTINYIRNSVKVTIDAYHGTVRFYFAQPSDPIAQTLHRIFPDLLKPMSEMPEDLRRHIRYPEGIFRIQSAVYATYHMTNPAVFYNKEDQWEVPAIETRGERTSMEPYYTMMKVPGERDAEFIQMLPFTPRRRDNLASWMIARSDGDHYGKLAVFSFPKQTLVFGPQQVVARINQDQVISPQITLWNQQGSEVIQGTLMVIPIEGSLIYVRPLYLRAQAGRIPELTRVIVAYQNRIVMERTLDDGIARLFGNADRSPRPPVTTTAANAPPTAAPSGQPANASTMAVDRLAMEAHDVYQRALAAQRAGDWAKYGEEIKRLGELLERMKSK